MTTAFSTLFFALVCVCAVTPARADTPQRAIPRRAIALTFDDLPYVNPAGGSYLPNARRVTSELMRVLRAHRAPAIGFVNEGQVDSAAGSALLQQWIAAGMTLGNHTYSHPDFNRLSVEEFKTEIVKGDLVTRRLMRSRQPYQLYFRHPMTHTGDTREKKEAIEQFLAARGYKTAPHTVENSDFIFNACYVRARLKKEDARVKELREAYLDFTFAAMDFAERVSPKLFGREIAQVLLLHANDIDADCLDEMLRRCEARGYRFITLDEAMRDPAYQTKDTMVSEYGPTWFVRWSRSLGRDISFRDEPDPPEWVMELNHQR